MFYRYQTSLVALVRHGFEWIHPNFLVSHDLSSFREISVEPPLPKCKIYQAPIVEVDGPWKIKFKRGKEKRPFPDIFSYQGCDIVSEKMRKIVQEVDDIEHQYFPIEFLNHEGEIVDMGEEFYRLIVSRVLDIDDTEAKPDVDFHAGAQRYLATIQIHSALRTYVESSPIWVQLLGSDYSYMNKEIIDRFKEEKLTGLKELSEFAGKGEESLGHVW